MPALLTALCLTFTLFSYCEKNLWFAFDNECFIIIILMDKISTLHTFVVHHTCFINRDCFLQTTRHLWTSTITTKWKTKATFLMFKSCNYCLLSIPWITYWKENELNEYVSTNINVNNKSQRRFFQFLEIDVMKFWFSIPQMK